MICPVRKGGAGGPPPPPAITTLSVTPLWNQAATIVFRLPD